MEETLLTPRFTLVPKSFFNADNCADALSEVCAVPSGDVVKSVEIPQYDAVLIYSVSGEVDALPEIFYVLDGLQACSEYNKILCSWRGGFLYLAIAQGKSLLLVNSYAAPDFTTAEYYLFLAMKSLQLNPEVSTLCMRTPVGQEEEMSLYRYFKSVVSL